MCFANGAGGRLLIGIEDGEAAPPPGQVVPPELLDRLRKRIGELTVNVQALPERAARGQRRRVHRAGDRALAQRRVDHATAATSCASATTCQPVVGDDVLRLANERPGRPWEAMASGVPRARLDAGQAAPLRRGHPRVGPGEGLGQGESPTDELLDPLRPGAGRALTHLGVLLRGHARPTGARWAPRRSCRPSSTTSAGRRSTSGSGTTAALSPVELVDAVWREVPDFRESYELAEGLFRRSVPAYDEKVVRELLVNALVHRPYTQRGDIYLNLHPDRLEVVNPGRLPLGVTPQNILHASRRRNDGLARVFHDLGLMEREGSGFDLMYDRLLSQGRPAPVPEEGTDWVKVTIQRRIVKPEVMQLIDGSRRALPADAARAHHARRPGADRGHDGPGAGGRRWRLADCGALDAVARAASWSWGWCRAPGGPRARATS